MTALARTLRGPIWLLWLGLLFGPRPASADTLVTADFDGNGGQDRAVFDQRAELIVAGSFAKVPASPPQPSSAGDRRVEDHPADTPDDAGTTQTSSAFVSPAVPAVGEARASSRFIDCAAAPARSGFSTTPGPRSPPSSR